MTYTPETALEQLARCGVRVNDTTIQVGRGSNAPGLRAWGAIDYLRKYAGYSVERG
jgi:hypothetical protein